jgi:hypothetical protein
MFDGLHYIYEGCLLDVQVDGNTRHFIMRLDFPERKTPICVQVKLQANKTLVQIQVDF